jgi:hypothetical protein
MLKRIIFYLFFGWYKIRLDIVLGLELVFKILILYNLHLVKLAYYYAESLLN